jgi:hypothetical protein
MSISNIIDPLTRKFYPQLIPPPVVSVPNLNAVLGAGNSAGSQTIENLDNLETQKIYQGNYLQLELGEAGDTVLLKGTTPLGVLHVGNGVSIEKLPVGVNNSVLVADNTQPLGVKWANETGDVESVSAGTNISLSGTGVNPIVNLASPLTSNLSFGGVSIVDNASQVGTAGQVLTCGAGGLTLWASLPAPPATEDLATTLLAGNSAGATDIDLNDNTLLKCAEITSTADLLLNPTGSIDANGKTLNMTNGEIHNCPLIHSQNNSDLDLEAKGTGNLVLITNNTDRLTINDTGDWTISGGTGNVGEALLSNGVGVSPSWGAIPAPSYTWQTWTPTFTGLTTGNGTLNARYLQIGPLTTVYVSFVLGSTSSITGGVVITNLPVNANFSNINAGIGTALSGYLTMRDDSPAQTVYGFCSYSGVSSVELRPFYLSGNYQIVSQINATSPFTWAQSDEFWLSFSYHSV